ncbi:L-aspartate oxidase, partial [Phytoactinopolyspora endophytica]|uniref:L-aspartate oxidase n=1 Tax=Phytoactinopolyspora endophytica TaxID=1642495 RepID=UPI00197B147F
MTEFRLPRRLLTEAPGWAEHADVVVVGSGIAGLTIALEARKAGRVLLVTKTGLPAGSTAWAQGGIAAALGPEDSPEQHLHDTLMAGGGLCDEDAVRTLVTEGPQRVRELAALGTEFERADDGTIALTREGGHRRDRIAHAGGDATGKEISRALIEALRAVEEDPGIDVIEHALVTDVLTDAHGRACGVSLHVIGEGRIDGVGAALGRAVVLATGGFGQVYASTTNPPVSTGDGVALALRAGAQIVDLEFVQFHPTVLWLGRTAKGQQPLISEAVRGEGAHLRDVEGRRFMADRHELAELAPRDVVAKGVVTAMAETAAEHVWLDARHLGAEFLAERFPTIVARCRSYGIDPATDLVPVAPAQHYASGGVRTDLRGRTTVPGLYACGEVSWTGVHGANRLASNSLLEGLVWGHRIAIDLAETLADVP